VATASGFLLQYCAATCHCRVNNTFSALLISPLSTGNAQPVFPPVSKALLMKIIIGTYENYPSGIAVALVRRFCTSPIDITRIRLQRRKSLIYKESEFHCCFKTRN
jgi:hypothetical protein